MKSFSNKEIKEIITEDIKPNIHVNINAPDANYCLYTENYIIGEGYKKFNNWLFNRNIIGWRHTFDCDNFAESFRVFLQIVHSKAMQKEKNLSKKQSVAFGVIWFTRDKGGGHAINFFVTKEDDKLVVKYIEPQNGKLVSLSQKEKESIFFILI